jgi:phosphoglycolate phosphatase
MRLFGKPLELVILDVDGVILDIHPRFEWNLKFVAQLMGLPTEPISTYFKDMRVGEIRGYPSLTICVKHFWPELEDRRIGKFKSKFHRIEREKPYLPISSSLTAIQWFCSNRIPVALCTTNSSESLSHRLRSVFINEAIFGAMSVSGEGYPTKPNPQALDPIFAKIPARRNHSVFVGDWYPDLDTARGAGVPFVAALSGGIPKNAFLKEGVSEDHIVKNLWNLLVHITAD